MRTRYAVALALVLALVGPPSPAAAWPAPAPEAANAWTEIAHPRPGGADSYLHDVVVPAAGDVWAVGYSFTVVGGAFEFRTYGQHCVDGLCTRANLPSREGAPATNFLYGIDEVSPTDMWTVGYSRDPAEPGITLAIRYDGSTWRIVDTPNPAGSFSSVLYSVAHLSATSAFAVGSYEDPNGNVTHPLAMQWNGSSWSLVDVPAVAGCAAATTLNDIDAVGTTLVMVGSCRTASGQDSGFVLSKSGALWQTQVAPGDPVLPVPSTLQSVTYVPGGGVWAVGTSNNFALQTAAGITIGNTGSGWTSLPVPQVGASTQLLAVAGISRNAVFSVGITAVSAFAERLSLYWTGRRYVDVPAGDYSNLRGVAYDPAGYWWSVGHDLGDSVIQRIAAR